jgi:hypothetical protein
MISAAALRAFDEALLGKLQPTTHVHLFAEMLVLQEAFQRCLFCEPASNRLDDLRRAINQKHGHAAVRSAATLPLDEVYSDPLALYDIRGKQCF